MKYLLSAIFIIYVIFLSLFSNAEFPSTEQGTSFLPYLSERPITEDGFYSLKIAWNIGTGKGVTYNFNTPTTGFQPLYVIILSFFAFLTSAFGGDKITYLRIAILFSGLIALFLSYLFYQLTKILDKNLDRIILQLVTSLLVLFNFKLFLNLFNGLETGLYLIFLLLAMIKVQSLIENKKNLKQIILLGFILGLTVLARNDFILITLIVILLLNLSKVIRLKDSIIILTVLFLTVLPWFAFVYSVQGSFIPTSASVQTGLTNNEIFYRIDQFLYSTFSSYIPFVHAGQSQSAVIYILIIVFAAFLYKYHLIDIKKYFGLQVIRIWFAAIIVISIVYLFFASQPYFFFRYLSIHMLIAIPFLTLMITRYLSNKSEKVLSLLALIVIGIFIINIGYYFHYPKQISGLALRTSFISSNQLTEKKIGMAQSGISGYFFDNVVNLDGKVNNDALLAIKTNSLYEYIVKEKIDVLIEWREWFEKIDSIKLSGDWQVSDKKVNDNKTSVFIEKSSEGSLSF